MVNPLKSGDIKWRQNNFFCSASVSRGIPDLLKMKLLEKKIASKAELVKLLLEGWLAGKYDKVNALFVDDKDVVSFKSISIFYPKTLDERVNKHLESGVVKKTTILRGLIVAWVKGRISVDHESSSEKDFNFVTIKITKATSVKLNKKLKTEGKSKSEFIIGLALAWIKNSASEIPADSDGVHDAALSVQMPDDLDKAVEQKMKKMGIKYKTVLFRQLIEKAVA